MSSFCSSNFHFAFFLVCYSNTLSETNAPELRVQRSLKICSLELSLRWDMSAKFPRGVAGPFLAYSLICTFSDHDLNTYKVPEESP